MKTSLLPRYGRMSAVVGLLAVLSGNAIAQTTHEDLNDLGQCVLGLLQTGDVHAYADRTVASADDWASLCPTNTPARNEVLKPFDDGVERSRHEVEASAGQFLAQAADLGVKASTVTFALKDVSLKMTNGATSFPSIQPERSMIPWTPEIDVVLEATPTGTNPARIGGTYRLALGVSGGAVKFPGGWRLLGGMRWQSFPPRLVGEDKARDLALLSRMASDPMLNLADDSALARAGEAIIRFLRTRDTNVFASEVAFSLDQMRTMAEQAAIREGRKPIAQADLDDYLKPRLAETLLSAGAVLGQLDRLGVVLTNAEIQVKTAAARYVRLQGNVDSLDNLSCQDLTFTLAVHSDLKTKSGAAISGDYEFTTQEGLRGTDRWAVMAPVRWRALPTVVLDDQEKASLDFENYVAEHLALPPKTVIPEVEWLKLDGKTPVKSTDFKGKIMILEFWATWCGPCQSAQAKLQSLCQSHPEWKDRLALVSVSIDDTAEIARKHLEERGWTNALNLWVGPGDWHSPSARAFRLTGVPTAYLINQQGKIVASGFPESIDYVERLKAMLR